MPTYGKSEASASVNLMLNSEKNKQRNVYVPRGLRICIIFKNVVEPSIVCIPNVVAVGLQTAFKEIVTNSAFKAMKPRLRDNQ